MSSPNEPLSGPQSGDPAEPVDPSTPDQPGRAQRRDERTREQLRQTQAERDALLVQRDALVDAEVRRLLANRLSDVDLAFRATGRAPGDFVAGDGTVDPAAVAAFAEDVTIRAPGLRRGPETVTGSGQRRVTGRELLNVGDPRPGWSDLLAARGGSEGAWRTGSTEQV